jgi:hypothetical protein
MDKVFYFPFEQLRPDIEDNVVLKVTLAVTGLSGLTGLLSSDILCHVLEIDYLGLESIVTDDDLKSTTD